MEATTTTKEHEKVLSTVFGLREKLWGYLDDGTAVGVLAWVLDNIKTPVNNVVSTIKDSTVDNIGEMG